MKDDTISRTAALDALADYIHNVDRVYSTGKLTHDDCMDAAHSVLDELPSAQPTGEDIQKMQDIEQAALEKAYECGKQDAVQWIPCKELLPSDYQWYYATCKSLVDNRENWVVEGCYTPWEHFNSTPMIKCGEAEVIAWMPKEFPEPYQEKE